MGVAVFSRFTEAGIARRAAERLRAIPPPPSAPETEIAPDEPSKPVIAVGGKRYVFTDENVIQFPQSEVKRVIGLVARMHGVTYAKVISKDGRIKYSNARMAAVCAVMQMRPDLTLHHVGKIFDRDHSTVVNAMNRRGFTR